MLVNKTFKLILDTQTKRQHMKYPRVRLSKKSAPDQKVICILLLAFYGFLGDASCRDPEVGYPASTIGV